MSQLLTSERLVISQKAKLVELTNEYLVSDENGNQVGYVRQEGQTAARKVVRALTRFDSMLSHTLALYDLSGQQVLQVHRPATMARSTVEVQWGPGAVAGYLRQENLMAKARFRMEGADGTPLGELRSENWRAWDFKITDPGGNLVAQITKKWSGLGREVFTTADNYVVEIAPFVQGPMRYLCLAAGVSVDLVLKQNDR